MTASMEADEVWTAIWSASGAAALSGRADGPPLDVPVALVELATQAAADIAAASNALGREVNVDGPALLAERAAIMGLSRGGDISCGGATRLLRSADGWVAASLARESDVDCVPAWLELAMPLPGDEPEQMWAAVEAAVRTRLAVELVERGELLGMPVARLAEFSAQPQRGLGPAEVHRIGDHPRASSMEDIVVVDLSSLWAGPLAANLLGLAGARVIKVESRQRPDGARRGSHVFFDLLHGGHESVCVDFTVAADVALLRRLVESADVVIEASRPRALAQLGVVAAAADGPRVWVSITGHGRAGAAGGRVGFGDDAAVAGGLVTRDDDGVCFCVDAVADPLTGLVAAAATLRALEAGGRWLIDAALSRTAAAAVDGQLTHIEIGNVAPPRARRPVSAAAELGEHTDAVAAEYG